LGKAMAKTLGKTHNPDPELWDKHPLSHNSGWSGGWPSTTVQRVGEERSKFWQAARGDPDGLPKQ
jgi:hypothetical protein